MEEILARHTGQPVARVAKDTDRDYIVGGADAVGWSTRSCSTAGRSR